MIRKRQAEDRIECEQQQQQHSKVKISDNANNRRPSNRKWKRQCVVSYTYIPNGIEKRSPIFAAFQCCCALCVNAVICFHGMMWTARLLIIPDVYEYAVDADVSDSFILPSFLPRHRKWLVLFCSGLLETSQCAITVFRVYYIPYNMLVSATTSAWPHKVMANGTNDGWHRVEMWRLFFTCHVY